MISVNKCPTPDHAQRGFVSVLSLLLLVSVVVFILMKSIDMSGSKALEAQHYFDSAAALALAESGKEVAMASITSAVNADDSAFITSCSNFTSSSPITLGQGSFAYIASPTPTSASLCPVRIKGTVRASNRTLEAWMNLSFINGTGGYGTSPTLTLENRYDTPAAAVFNLAWRRLGSTGHSPPGGQSVASTCTLPSCGMQWNLESSSGLPSVGSLGTSVGIGAGESATVEQTLSVERNYAEVGLMLGGLVSQPTIKGRYYDDKQTANTQNQTVTYGTTPNGTNSWCTGADTLVFGVSGRGDDDPTAAFSSVVFNSAGTPSQPTALTWVSHFPNTDGSSPDMYGDIFSEIWYTYNPYVLLSGASSTGTTVTVASTSGLQTGTLLKVDAGTGLLQGTTRVSSVLSPTQFVIDKAPSIALSGATLCGGICALFNGTSADNLKTTFALTRATAAAQQWAGGFVCFSGVDPNKIRRITSSHLHVQQWHEVTSGE